ncbi:hypothetical protein [Antarcticirhabdus aurantiaca]|uniref:Uncharacterized protein n=2 Tax=Antarcticirhabdus aurantiaca TaxID=2606717 RepID=A0ACD4NX97_9HYPH|nr:hypothetical protein OXU80_13925 [Jeongeuplla avenae]
MTGTEKDFELLIADILAADDDAPADPKGREPGAMYRAAFAAAEARAAQERRRRAREGLAAHKARGVVGEAQVADARAKLARLSIANDDGGKLTMAARKQSSDGSGDADVLAQALAELAARED